MWGQIAALAAPKVFEALGGLFGGSNYKRPAGTVGTDQLVKMMKHGADFQDLMGMGMPLSSRFLGNANKKLMKQGLTPDQINQLRGGGFGMGGGDPAQMGPMGFDPFMAMMPALMGNQSLFSNPAASGWLNNVFSQFMPQAPSGIPPGGIPLGAPGFGGIPGAGSAKPGPAPSPFVGLRGLAGPFGNGGGAMLPFQFNKR